MRTMLMMLMVTGLVAQTAMPPAATRKIDFEKDVQPILAERCHSCHGPDVQQSGLRLDRRQAAMRGGDYGPVIVPGNSAGSKLIRRLVSGDGGMVMPPTGALTSEEIGVLRAWIDQGADFRIEVKNEAPPKPVDPRVQALITAARTSDVAALRRAIEADRAQVVNARDAAGSTLLHHAAGFGSVETLQALLAAGVDVNAKNRRGSTALLWAIGDLAKVRLLAEHGANVNVRQADGRSPLLQAASTGDGQETVRYLLEQGADPNIASANGLTPLMAASGRNAIEVMRLLIARDAKVNARSGDGSTALMRAAATGNPATVKLLLDHGADPLVANKRKETALAESTTAGVEETVRLLLAKGARVNTQNDRGYSPLMLAAASDLQPAGVVKLLLAQGADPNLTAEGETARSLAAKRGDTVVARLLGASEAERKAGGVAPIAIKAQATHTAPVAVEKAMALLEKQSHNFIRIGGCNSCHAQDLPSAAAALARDRGLKAPLAIAQLSEAGRGTSTERVMDFGVIGVGSVAWELFDFGMNRAPRNDYTDAVARYIALMQASDGHWKTNEGLRPPMSNGRHQVAALSIYALKHYGHADARERIARAGAWLAQTRPVYTQDRAYQVLGLAWAGLDSAAAARILAGAQRADGGWNQLPGMGSDAYATGLALYALGAGGKMAPSHPVYQKGLAYLMKTQAADGSWRVKSRSIWFQPYFESGFPYGPDQWISAAGTAWASMAISLAQEPAATVSRR